jgi:hypothetical protein
MAWTGQANYARAQEYAAEAEGARADGDLDKAAALAAIGQVHATLALTVATALPGSNIEGWRDVAGNS